MAEHPALFIALIVGPLAAAKKRFDAGSSEIVFGTGREISDITKLGIKKVYFKEKGTNSVVAEAELTSINQNIISDRLEEYRHETWNFYYGFRNLKYHTKPIPMSSLRYFRSSEPLKNTVRSFAIIHDPEFYSDINFSDKDPKGISNKTLKVPSLGEILNNNDIQKCFAVGSMGGMRRNVKDNILVLISDPFKGLYLDHWDDDVLHYTGMGKNGDQSLTYSQNKTLAKSLSKNITLHLLEARDNQKYTYVGEAKLLGDPYQSRQLDENGQDRLVWMFPVKPVIKTEAAVLTLLQARKIEESQARFAAKMADEVLKRRALAGKRNPERRKSTTTVYLRNQDVTAYAKRMAAGCCDLCKNAAPFLNKHKEGYLECHHIVWLAKGGEDIVENTVALCPNCHRKMHILNDKNDCETLKARALARA